MKLNTRLRLRRWLVWAARIVTGATFIVSGWAKAVDPWGFIIKVGEYLSVWHLSVPHEAIVTGCAALACIEFATGIMLATGSLKRSSALVATAMMAFMLPLMVYIAVADPVADCGCFGDLWHISNGATLAKNVALTALAVYLLLRNRTVPGLYAAPVQWLELTGALAFPLVLIFAGYHVQPVVDFRDYPVGSTVFAGTGGLSGQPRQEVYIYEKDGRRAEFGLDELPDSTWTFVDVVGDEHLGSAFGGGIEVRDEGGYDVAADLADETGRRLFIIIPEPDMHYLIHAHYVSRLAQWCRRYGTAICAVVGQGGNAAEKWADWTRPDFDIYTADATALKQMVRGREGVVYADGGVIRWKRTLASMPPSVPDGGADALDRLSPPDDGTFHTRAVLVLAAWLVVVYLLSLSPAALRILTRKARK